MSRDDSDEAYVIDLCDALLGCKAQRQARFDFLRGDPGPSGRRVRLPVDAYWPELHLVVEYRERQHYESVPIMDRRRTISGVPRGAQRRNYDERRETLLPKHGLSLVVLRNDEFELTARKRLRRYAESDRAVVRAALAKFVKG